jgi:UDP-glucuronate 4-epimerase
LKSILITGVAGFIGYHVASRLSSFEFNLVGIDNLNTYYDSNLKQSRIGLLENSIIFHEGDISDEKFLNEIFEKYNFSIVIHLAAQAGVRYSIDNPDAYINSNINGFYNILETCRNHPVKHLVFASSSSVYGRNTKIPFEESDQADQPVSLYAATKKSNELMAHTYSHLYKIPITGLRFFTVYGPYGRPDMAYFNFIDRYFQNKPIKIFNNGDFENDLFRDFTFIDDIVEAIVKLIALPPSSEIPYDIFNIGNNQPERLMEFINVLEECLSKSLGEEIEFIKEFEAIKPGDVRATFASIDKLHQKINYKPNTPLREGLQKFTDWYVKYYRK